jgi:hypothetical protein
LHGGLALFDVYRFDRALIGGLLGGVLEFSGDLINKNYSYTVAHRKDFRASADTKTARSAGIINGNFHSASQNKSNIRIEYQILAKWSNENVFVEKIGFCAILLPEWCGMGAEG